MTRRVLVLIGVAGLLAAYVLGERLFPGPSLDPATSVSRENQQPPEASMRAPGPPAKLNPLEGLAEGSFSAMLERPLFNPGRSPRPQAPPPPPPPPPPEEPPPAAEPVMAGPVAEDFKLLAVATGPSGPVAALRLAASGEVLYLRKGHTLDAWTVIDVTDRAVVIGTPDNPDDNVTLTLFEEVPASAPGADAGNLLEPAP